MNFFLTEEQKDFQRAAQKFAKGEFDKDLAMELDEKGEFPLKIWKKAADLGFIGIHFPEELGGLGGGAIESAIVAEEFCRRDSGIGVSLGLADFGSELILQHGNNEQKERFLPFIAKGKTISTLACSTVSTSVRRTGSCYVSNGKEEFIVNACMADLFVFVCLLSEALSSESRLVAFIIEKDWNGFHVTRRDTLGMRMISSGQLTMSDLRVPEENIFIREDQGFLPEEAIYDVSNIKIAALALGMAQGAFDRALGYAKEREAFGRPIGQFQAIQHYLANMVTEIELARLMTYKAAWLHSNGLPCDAESNIAKLASSEAALYATSRGMQILAGYGYMMEYDMQRYWRDAKIFEFAPMANEMTHNFLGDNLGLPRSS